MPQSVTVDDVETSVAQLATELAQVQARLAGVSREFAAWRREQDVQRAEYAADHELVAQLRACCEILLNDAPSWQLVESLLRSDGRNGRGPLLQQLRRLCGRRVLTLNDH